MKSRILRHSKVKANKTFEKCVYLLISLSVEHERKNNSFAACSDIIYGGCVFKRDSAANKFWRKEQIHFVRRCVSATSAKGTRQSYTYSHHLIIVPNDAENFSRKLHFNSNWQLCGSVARRRLCAREMRSDTRSWIIIKTHIRFSSFPFNSPFVPLYSNHK